MLDQMQLVSRFQAIAEAGSVRKAAEKLNITQPALSRSLGQLERHYGQALVERHARGVRPTAFGQKLLGTISRVLREWELAEQGLTSPGSDMLGVLRLSAGPLWTSSVLPPVITRLQTLFPYLTLEIGFVAGDGLMTALLEGRLDVAFGGLPINERANTQIASHQFTSVRDRVVARQGHPIHDCAPDDYDALHHYPWITFATDPVYEDETQHAVVERTGLAPNIRVRSTSLLAVIRLLQEGDYLCMLPDAFVMGVPGGNITPTPIELGRRITRSGIFYRTSIANHEPLRVLIDMCSRYFELGLASRQRPV